MGRGKEQLPMKRDGSGGGHREEGGLIGGLGGGRE